MTLDHSQCTVVRTPQWEEHTCPPCPHGLERSYLITLTTDPQANDRQRRLKMHVLDNLMCGDAYHAEALARPAEAR